eukprot:843617-Prymnesium_polylepis.1
MSPRRRSRRAARAPLVPYRAPLSPSAGSESVPWEGRPAATRHCDSSRPTTSAASAGRSCDFWCKVASWEPCRSSIAAPPSACDTSPAASAELALARQRRRRQRGTENRTWT